MSENNRAMTVRPNGAVEADESEGKAFAEKTKALWATANAANNPSIANALAELGGHYSLDPALGEIMLLGGRPYIGFEGYLRIAEEHPQYDGYTLRAMTESERKDAKVGPDEFAYICEVHRKDRRFPSVGYGVASDASVSAAPLRVYKREIAQKRAFHRALKMAFRAGIPDYDEAVEALEYGEAVQVISKAPGADKPPALPAPDWPKFWHACHGLGASDSDVHQALGVASVKEWTGTLEDAYARVESFIAARDSAGPVITAEMMDEPDETEREKAAAAGQVIDPPEPPDPEIHNFGDLWNAVKARWQMSSSDALKELGYARQSDIALPPAEIWAELKAVMKERPV